MAHAPGSRVSRFRLVALLGAGGMGEVWRATDENGGPQVALKLVRAGARDEGFLTRFEREARAAQKVSHPNVVSTVEVGRDGSVPYIALELVEGGSLKDLLKKEQSLPWRRAAALGAGIARGLAAIHEQGLVHRDVKPGNVLIAADGRPIVSDLGLVRGENLGQTVAGLTKTGEILGTLDYAAPEQIDGVRGKVSARSDLYALGVTLHHAIAGRPPFEETGVSLMRQHLVEPPPPLGSLVPDVPRELEKLVLRLLAKEPEDRPASAAEVALALDALATSATRGRARALGVAVAALALVGAVAGLAVAARPAPLEPPAHPSSSSSTTATAPPPAKVPLPLGVAPDKGVLEVVGLLASGAPRWKFHDQAYSLAISPSGAKFAVAGNAGSCYVGDVETGETLQPISIGRCQGLGKLAFTPDEKRVVVCCDARVYVFDVASGACVQTLDHKEPISFVAPLADGSFFMAGTRTVALRTREGQVRSFSLLETKADATLDTTAIEITAAGVSSDEKFGVVATSASTLYRFELPSFERRQSSLMGVDRRPSALAVLPGSRSVALGFLDGSLMIWDLDHDRGSEVESPFRNNVWTLSVSRDGSRLLSSDGYGNLALASLDTRTRPHVFQAHDGFAWARLLPDGRRAISLGMNDGRVRVWDMVERRCLSKVEGHDKAVRGAAVTPAGDAVVTVGDDGQLLVWKTSGGEPRTIKVTSPTAIRAVCLPKPALAAVSVFDGRVAVVELEGDPKPHFLGKNDGFGLSIAASSDGERLVSTSEAGDAIVWDLTTMAQYVKIMAPENPQNGKSPWMLAAAFSPTSDRLLLATQLSSGFMYRVGASGTPKEVELRGASPDGALGLAFDKRGELAVSAGFLGKIGLWRMPSGTPLDRAFHHLNSCVRAVPTPDGLYLVSAGGNSGGIDPFDRTLKLWDVEKGTELDSIDFARLADSVCSIAFGDDPRTFYVVTTRGLIVKFKIHR
jgi:WD40 repeat protein